MSFFRFSFPALALSKKVGAYVIATFCVLAMSQTAMADPVKIELVGESKSIQPGKPFYVALHLDHKKNYHTYWKFPGIVGVATNMDWHLPTGWKADAIEWPEPIRVMMFTIQAQGYHGELVLPIKITPPANLKAGEKVTLSGKAAWMACYRECNPGFKELSLTLPVSDETPVFDTRLGKLFAEARAAMPKPLKGWDLSAKRRDDKIVLRLSPESAEAEKKSTSITEIFFFTVDGLIDASKPQTFRQEKDGTLIMELLVSEYATKPLPTSLNGLLQTSDSWTTPGASKSARISVPISGL